MSIAKEIIDQQEKLATKRATYDSHCREVAEVLLPRQDNFFREETTEGEKRNQKIVSSVAQEALNKFSAAMESILTPRSSRWHRVTTDIDELQENQEVQEYLDAVTDTLFKKRYASSANYASQQHETYMSLGAFGTGVLILESNPETRGFTYKSSHISEHFFMENNKRQIDVDYWRYKLTARKAVEKFPKGLPEKVIRAAEKDPRQEFEFISCVRPNEEYKDTDDYRSFKFRSYHVCVEDNAFLGEGGYRTFPFIVSRYVTAPNEIYGRSPGMTALSEIKMVNAIRKSDLRARHMAIDPPVLTANDIALRRPLMKPGAVNFGALDINGNPMIRPYDNQARIDVSNDLLSQSHEIINDIFLVTLFQILVDSPQMTATEVLQRAQEKGALLSPTAGRQQSEALGPMIEREIDILASFDELPPMPDVLLEYGADYNIEYTAPLNVMQKAGEAQAAQRLLEASLPYAQLDPSIIHNFDFDEYINIVKDSLGVPARMMRSKEEKQQIRQAEQQQQMMQSIIDSAPSVTGSIKDIADAQSKLSG